MSADNGYIVRRLFNDKERIGVFYYCASVEEDAEAFTEDRAILNRDTGKRLIYDSADEAVRVAHITENIAPTEYGVHVFIDVYEGYENA